VTDGLQGDRTLCCEVLKPRWSIVYLTKTAYTKRYGHEPEDFKETASDKEPKIKPFELKFADGSSVQTYRVIDGEEGAWEMQP
jgi:hypothetical protein